MAKAKAEAVWPDGKLCRVRRAPITVICSGSRMPAGRCIGRPILMPRQTSPAISEPTTIAQKTRG